MSESIPETQPPTFDNEQARQFYRTATNPQRLPKKYWPGKDVEVDLFDAAVIQSYQDSVKRKHYEALEERTGSAQTDPSEVFLRELARISAAVEYVQGVPIAEIHHDGLDNPQMQKEGAFNYVLHVAKGGAKEIKRLHNETLLAQKNTSSLTPGVERIAAQDQPLEVLSDYKDLDERIRRLYHGYRIDKVSAQALMLLLELQKSTASPERQIQALYDIRCELERKIMRWMFELGPADGGEKDLRLEKGTVYIQKIVGRPRRRIGGLRLQRLVGEVYTEIGEGDDQLQVRDHVYSHIGYALDKLYRL